VCCVLGTAIFVSVLYTTVLVTYNNVGTCVVYNRNNHNNSNGKYNDNEAHHTNNNKGISNDICMQGVTMCCVGATL
jgi:Na+/H+-dicarboxylate symporter